MTIRNLIRGMSIASAVLLTLGPSAHAQDASGMSAEEIQERFNSQLTRGLVIAPSAGSVSEDPAETAPVENYVEIAPEQQINIQVSFDFDSAALRNSEKTKLATLCEVMKASDIQLFRIVGHTDASGSAEYNERLSLLRAEEVKRHMVNDCGLDPARLEALGVGEAYPVNTADPRSEQNRRVEFQAMS